MNFKAKKLYPETVKRYKNRKALHIKFIPKNLRYFDTSFRPLVNLIDDNRKGWMVSEQAIEHITNCLHIFCAECRNEHFHKDNIGIEDIEEVKTIRHNAILLFYYLLGAYAFSRNIKEDEKTLGIVDRRFDDMYQTIMKQSAGGDYFLLQFKDSQPVLVALPMNHGDPEYDENGLMINPTLRFVKVNRNIDDDWHKDDWHRIENDVDSDLNVFITPDNIPQSIYYIDKVSGKQKSIQW